MAADKVTALVIPVEGPIERVDIHRGDNGLDELQRLVGGGLVQCVPSPPFLVCRERLSVWINEEGKFRPDLARNGRATDFMVPGVGLFPGDYISGPLVLTGCTPTGDLGVVPPEAVRRAELIESEAA